MSGSVIVWDIETVPDLRGFAAAKGLLDRSDDEVRAEMGDKFPKLIYHSIICIGGSMPVTKMNVGSSPRSVLPV